jgi:hypothetical protein
VDELTRYQRPDDPAFAEWLAGAMNMAFSEGEAWPGSRASVTADGRVRLVFGDTGAAVLLSAEADAG